MGAARAKLTGRWAETVQRWTGGGLSDRGPLAATRTARGWRVRRADLEAWLVGADDLPAREGEDLRAALRAVRGTSSPTP